MAASAKEGVGLWLNRSVSRTPSPGQATKGRCTPLNPRKSVLEPCQVLVSGDEGGQIKIWNGAGECVGGLAGHTAAVTVLCGVGYESRRSSDSRVNVCCNAK